MQEGYRKVMGHSGASGLSVEEKADDGLGAFFVCEWGQQVTA